MGFDRSLGSTSKGSAERGKVWKSPQARIRSCLLHSLKLTFSPLKMVVSNRNFLFQGALFSGAKLLLVSGSQGTSNIHQIYRVPGGFFRSNRKLERVLIFVGGERMEQLEMSNEQADRYLIRVAWFMWIMKIEDRWYKQIWLCKWYL